MGQDNLQPDLGGRDLEEWCVHAEQCFEHIGQQAQDQGIALEGWDEGMREINDRIAEIRALLSGDDADSAMVRWNSVPDANDRDTLVGAHLALEAEFLAQAPSIRTKVGELSRGQTMDWFRYKDELPEHRGWIKEVKSHLAVHWPSDELFEECELLDEMIDELAELLSAEEPTKEDYANVIELREAVRKNDRWATFVDQANEFMQKLAAAEKARAMSSRSSVAAPRRGYNDAVLAGREPSQVTERASGWSTGFDANGRKGLHWRGASLLPGSPKRRF